MWLFWVFTSSCLYQLSHTCAVLTLVFTHSHPPTYPGREEGGIIVVFYVECFSNNNNNNKTVCLCQQMVYFFTLHSCEEKISARERPPPSNFEQLALSKYFVTSRRWYPLRLSVLLLVCLNYAIISSWLAFLSSPSTHKLVTTSINSEHREGK